jgi:hypothetical protein
MESLTDVGGEGAATRTSTLQETSMDLKSVLGRCRVNVDEQTGTSVDVDGSFFEAAQAASMN